ncbi:MAG: hypothetical protein GWO04_41345, partial [Actinobacteria bacterium]|nr:hypothetical protein [Actinomycetota bacterium]
GAAAEAFVLPADVELVTSTRLARYGLSYERYQQVFGEARVLGGQITLYRDDDGVITSVIGAHYPDITPSNTVRLGAAEARGIAERDIGPEGERITELMIDPASGRYFFRVETRRPDSRWILWIGAETGRILNRYDALAHQGATCGSLADTPCGYGVEYDHGDSSDIKDLEVENLLAADSTFFLTSPPDEPYCPDGPFCLWAEPLTING